MFRNVWKIIANNAGLKVTAMVLALMLWFYVVDELKRGSEEDRQFLNKVLPQEGVFAKKLPIKPIFIGAPRFGFAIDSRKVVVSPEYCIVVGQKDLMSRIKFAYTMPIDVRGVSKSFTTSVPISPIAPGIYMEETLVQITVPVDVEAR